MVADFIAESLYRICNTSYHRLPSWRRRWNATPGGHSHIRFPGANQTILHSWGKPQNYAEYIRPRFREPHLHTVLILGGYGFFGARICTALARDPAIRVLVGGRDRAKALQLTQTLRLPDENAVAVDATSAELAAQFGALRVDTVIHAAGPFQSQDYSVANAAIKAGANYIDLADGRAFVAGICALDEAAKSRGVTVISGASSVPALSSAVVDQYLPNFSRLDSIRTGIGAGARSPGLATMRAVFSYCGKPIRRWENGAWTTTQGWLDTVRYRFPDPVGTRWLGSCDVPDLELFPKRYPGVCAVSFHAGIAGTVGHAAVWSLASLVQRGALRSVVPFARLLNAISPWFARFGSDKSAMFVELKGLDRDARPLRQTWSLIVAENHGPYIPCGASIALARKLAAGAKLPAGAQACMGLLTVAEYLEPLAGLAIRIVAPRE